MKSSYLCIIKTD